MSQALPSSIPELLRTVSGLLQSGRHVEAAKALRRALDLAPTDATVAAVVARMVTLARTWLTFGQTQLAADALSPLAASRHANGALLKLYGHALMATGRKQEAEAVFRGWLAREPHSKDAALRLAAVLADSGGSAEAERLIRAVTAREGATPESAFVLGRALLGLARFDEAEDQFRHVVQAQPHHVTAQRNLAELVWMQTGNASAACIGLDDALHKQPQLRALRIAKAQVLLGARQAPEALAEIEAGLAREPLAIDLLNAAATIALGFDGVRALGFAKRALAIAPEDRGSITAFGKALLATGEARTALDTAMKLQAAYPADGQAMALQADAMRMLGDDGYRELLDYSLLVQAAALETPRGWPNLAAYVADVQLALERAHVFKAHPIGNSLRQGSQIELFPERSPDPAIRAFPSAIDGPIRHYIEALGRGSGVMQRRNTGHYRVSGIWSVRLRPHGFHVNHYHPEGWISSACYLHIPPSVERAGDEGWLKFGEPAFPTLPALGPEYFLKPEPGLLALFPSYMWHGTVPFSGPANESRLTIAFDVVPVGAE